MADNFPLLKTKNYVPQTSSGLVRRPRLLEKLDLSLERKLLLITAPAGYGKTTLIAEWLEHHGRSAVWLSVDIGDNDLVRFWTYVIASLQAHYPDMGEETLNLLRLSQQATVETLLTPLISALDGLSSQVILVIDDYHLINNQDVHRSIEFLIDFLPSPVLLVIATRQDPLLRLGRLRALAELVELRAADLRFTVEESKAFLTRSMGLELSDEDLAEVEARTEGWVAGLQLIALTLQGRADAASYVRSFTGDHRFIVEYLLEEVLKQQEEDVQSFLLKTSLLERMSGPLCNSITGLDNGREMLLKLERANLFIVPLDDAGEWFRYHHLFGEFLSGRLQAQFSDDLPQLHTRASRWCEANGFIVEAIDHSLAADRPERAAALIESVSRTMMNGQLPLARILGWLDALPAEFVKIRPRLSLMYAWWLVWSARFGESANRLADVENYLKTTDAHIDQATRLLILGEVATIRANISYATGDIGATMTYADEALDLLPVDEGLLASLAALFLGHANRLDGKPSAALEAYERIMVFEPDSLFVPATVIAMGHYPQLRSMQGQLSQAELDHRRALRFIAEQRQTALPASGITYVDMAGVWYEWNELEKAAAYLQTGMRLCRHWEALLESQVDAHIMMARVKHAQGNTARRDHWLQQAIHLGRSHGLPKLARRAEVYQAHLWIEAHDLEATREWARIHNVSSDGEFDYAQEAERLVLARLLVAEGLVNQANDLLQGLLEAARSAGRVKSQIETLCIQARAFHAQGSERRDLVALEAALTLAETKGYVRTFVDEGEVVAHLLRRAATRGIFPAYATRLLEVFQESQVVDMSAGQPLVEPLTQRELEILALIAAGLPNKGIALELVIAESTVKRHIANIYGKLNVRSRTQAMTRAQELKLL